MPYRLTSPDTLTLWPHRSLSPRGFVAFIGVTATLFALPLATQIGSRALWGLLPFLLAAVTGVWVALRRSYRTETEDLVLSENAITVTRHSPGRQDRVWTANPYWVRPALHPTGGPVPDYLTLTGNGRTVELGAFLTRDERRALFALLSDRLADLRATNPTVT